MICNYLADVYFGYVKLTQWDMNEESTSSNGEFRVGR